MITRRVNSAAETLFRAIKSNSDNRIADGEIQIGPSRQLGNNHLVTLVLKDNGVYAKVNSEPSVRIGDLSAIRNSDPRSLRTILQGLKKEERSVEPIEKPKRVVEEPQASNQDTAAVRLSPTVENRPLVELIDPANTTPIPLKDLFAPGQADTGAVRLSLGNIEPFVILLHPVVEQGGSLSNSFHSFLRRTDVRDLLSLSGVSTNNRVGVITEEKDGYRFSAFRAWNYNFGVLNRLDRLIGVHVERTDGRFLTSKEKREIQERFQLQFTSNEGYAGPPLQLASLGEQVLNLPGERTVLSTTGLAISANLNLCTGGITYNNPLNEDILFQGRPNSNTLQQVEILFG